MSADGREGGGLARGAVVLIAFAASMCCASSIAEFAHRLPSAGSLYTYGSRGLGRTGGFLTGWMMVFAYVLYVPAGIALTSAYTSQLLAGAFHVAVSAWALFVIIAGAVATIAYLGIRTSSSVDMVLVVGEVAVIAALACRCRWQPRRSRFLLPERTRLTPRRHATPRAESGAFHIYVTLPVLLA